MNSQNKELGQFLGILTSLLVNNPALLNINDPPLLVFTSPKNPKSLLSSAKQHKQYYYNAI